MSDDWSAVQDAYGCSRGRSCYCISDDERRCVEDELATAAKAARADAPPASHPQPITDI